MNHILPKSKVLRTAWWMVLALAMTVRAATPAPSTQAAAGLIPAPQYAHVAHLAADLISRYHYRALPLDDALSERIFDHYLKSLDSEKLFFVQADIDQLATIRRRLDDAIRDENLDLFFFMFNFYVQRAAERIAYARSLLATGFDFTSKESYPYERGKAAWASSEGEMHELWRLRVKNDWLRLKLAGKDDGSIAATLDRRYDNSLKRIDRLRSEDVFETLMNAYTMAVEPHTSFKGPRAAEDSGIQMKLSMVGIGLVLTEKDGDTMIRELVPGGPSALSGRLKVGDRIVGVSQRQDDAMTDVRNWRLDDIVALIRGTVGSVVFLEVLPADAGRHGGHRLVSLVREQLAMQEQRARKTVLALPDGNATRLVGVIALPSFYHDFVARQKGDRNFKSAAHDVARLLAELEAEKVDSVLIDLRNNGGGSLTEAVELTGLFVGRGPVVQQRDARGVVTVERDSRAAVAWHGPLGVLINRGSASASEIFAAAIQDYGRGLVIGENSYGKGTVQSVFSLDQATGNAQPKLGELRLTVAQFFRIDGSTTQLRGVQPDVSLPGAFDAEKYGESSFDNPLPWIRIEATAFSAASHLKSLLPALLKRHVVRIKADSEFQYLAEDIAEFESQRSRNLISLNAAERRTERTAQAARLAARKTARTLLDDGLQADERDLADELAAEHARKTAKDIWLTEAVHILGDEVGLLTRSSAWIPVSSQARP
jgi:carboxyl-terminal processing protease